MKTRWAGLMTAATLILANPVMAENKTFGISAFGELKYRQDFKHFDYVNPNAPKGGVIKLSGIDSFNSLNPFIIRGVAAAGTELLHGTLMERAMDEPDALYSYIASSLEIGEKRRKITFNINPKATFNDGSVITANDICYSFKTLIHDGHPRFRVIFKEVEKTEAKSRHSVIFHFKKDASRNLLLRLAELPVFSKDYYSKIPFKKASLTPPVSSGPYRVEKIIPGRHITYSRIQNYWASNIATMKGRHNFNKISFEYFRDRGVALEAFFAGIYDFREEYTSRAWATQYNKRPVRGGQIKRQSLKDNTPSGFQAFFFNLRKPKFRDRKVRAALDLAFDFEWTNKTLFYNLYKRTNSIFANSDLAATEKPNEHELNLLKSLSDQIPPEVFNSPYKSPKSKGTGRNRTNLRKAAALLNSAGWSIKNNLKLINKNGEHFTIEFLLYEASFSRVINPYIRNLKRLGIGATVRIIDVANFQNRLNVYDYDVIIQRYVQPNTPGIEQKTYFASETANIPGSRNLAGIKNPAVDSLLEKVIIARNRRDLKIATRALDRVIMWNKFFIPQWYKGVHNIAYWDKFGKPKIKPKFDTGVLDTWWYESKKAKLLTRSKNKK